MQCKVDDVTVGTQNLSAADAALSYFGFIALDGSANGIYNLVHSGFVTSPAKLVWGSASYLTITEGDGILNKVVQKIILTAPDCNEVLPPVRPVITDKLIVTPVPSKAGTNFNIYVNLDDSSEVMVLIFNTAGTLISQFRNAELQKSTTFTTSIPTSGVYIIKALTAEGEFSKSIIIN